MFPLTVILIYVAVISFAIYTFKNKKPLKWSEILNAIPFNQSLKTIIESDHDDIYRIPGPLRLPFFGTKWQNTKMNKLHEFYQSECSVSDIKRYFINKFIFSFRFK